MGQNLTIKKKKSEGGGINEAVIDASIGNFFVSPYCWCLTLVWTPVPLLSPLLYACLPFFCCLCSRKEKPFPTLWFPSIFFTSLSLSLRRMYFFFSHSDTVHFKQFFLCLLACLFASAVLLFSVVFYPSLPNPLFWLIFRSYCQFHPSVPTISLPYDLKHSILICNYRKRFSVTFVFLQITYSYFWSHSPMLLSLVVKMGVSIFLNAPSVLNRT